VCVSCACRVVSRRVASCIVYHSRLAVEVKGSEGEHSSHRLSREGMIFLEKSVNTALSARRVMISSHHSTP
jgi:hypothetical protein